MKIHTIFNSNTYESSFYNELDYENAHFDLNKILPNNILIIASLGLWTGRCSAYKVINNNNLNSILTQSQGDCYEVYYDGYNVRAKDIHHDGTNYYTFRLIKDNVNIDNLLEKLYNGTATRNDINNYTKSLRPYIQDIYGWK